MAIVAPDNNPTVVPTEARKQGSLWVLLAGLAGLLLDLLPIVPIPDEWKPWMPVATAVLGYVAHQRWGPDEYRPDV